MSEIAPGWYKDPADPETQRYWDGEGWLGDPLPADATPPAGPPPAAPASAPSAIAPTPQAASGAPQPQANPGPPQANPGAPQAAPGGPQAAPGGPQAAPGGPQAAPGSRPAAYPISPGHAGPPPPHPYPAGPPPHGAPPNAGPPPHPGAPPQHVGPPPYPYPGFAPPAPRPHGLAVAPLASRLVARLIDIAIVAVLAAVVNGWFAYQWWREVEPLVRAAMADPLSSNPQPSTRSQWLILTMLFITTALWLAYEVPALGNTGQTLGKRIMHIRVVPQEALQPLGFGRAFRRWGRLGMWTPMWGCYGIGLLFQLVSSASVLFDQPLHRAFHDKVAGTIVVQAPPGTQLGQAVKKDDSNATGGSR